MIISARAKHLFCTPLALLLTALLTHTSTPPAAAEAQKVKDGKDAYESYFLGIKSATFVNGDKRMKVKARHSALRWETIDIASLTLLAGRSTQPPVYLTEFTAEWTPEGGLVMYRQYAGEEFRKQIKCRGMILRHSEKKLTVSISAPQRCIRIPKRFNSVTKTPRGQVQAAYLVANLGQDDQTITDTAPGRQSTGLNPLKFTRWLRKGSCTPLKA